MELRNLPWLAGRGYNTFGIYLNDIVCHRVAPPVKASYLAVLFENFTDPISTGREELGFPKVFAEIPDAIITSDGEDEKRVHTLSWDGYEFLRLELSLASFPAEQSPALHPEQRHYTHPTKSGILHQRYIPAVGESGKADADYATFCPPPPNPPTVLQFKTLRSDATAAVTEAVCPAIIESQAQAQAQADGAYQFYKGAVKLQIKRGSFEQLPTLHNVVDALAEIRIKRCKEVALQQFQGASDLGEFRTPSCRARIEFCSNFADERLIVLHFCSSEQPTHRKVNTRKMGKMMVMASVLFVAGEQARFV